MFEKEHALQVIKFCGERSGALKIGTKAAPGTLAHAGYKLTDIEKAIDAVERLSGWTDFCCCGAVEASSRGICVERTPDGRRMVYLWAPWQASQGRTVL